MGVDSTPKILLVDDTIENLVLLKALLREVQAEVISVSSSKEALLLSESEEFALFLLDIQMPEVDGFQLAEHIRSTTKNRVTPIIFITAVHLDRVSEAKAYECGAVDFIRKPYNSTILLNKVDVFLELYRQKAELDHKNRALSQALHRQKKLESSLKACASSIQAMAEDQTEMIFRIDQDERIQYVNQAFCKFAGVFANGVKDEKLGRIKPELLQQLEHLPQLLDQEHPVAQIEGILTNAKGEARWIEWSIRLEEQNEALHRVYQAVGRDISEQKQVKEALLRKGILLQRAERMAKLGSWEWNSHTKLLTVSEGIYRIYGIEKSQAKQTLDLLLSNVHSDDREGLERVFANLPRKNRKVTLQHRVVTASGAVKYIHVEFTVAYHIAGDFLSIVGFSQDISEYKLIEMALKENLNQFLELTNSLPQPIYEIDRQGKLTYLNQVGCLFLECSRAIADEEVYLMEFIASEEHQDWERIMEQIHQKRDLVVGEFTLITRKGDLRNVILYAAPVVSGKGEQRARGILLDITKRVQEEKVLQENARNYMRIISSMKETEEEISKDNRKLKQRVEKEIETNEFQQQLLVQKSKLEALGKLASSMVHEINQPLTGISMVMDNILLRMSMDKISEKYLREKCMQVFDDIDRIKNYLQYVGLFSTAQKEDKTEMLDVNKGVCNALHLVEKQYKNWAVELKLELYSDPVFIDGNRYKFEQVMVDLLLHAYESIEEKRQLVKGKRGHNWIRIVTDVSKKEALIRIRDNGMGMDHENLNYIFEPFFTTKESGNGSGLGLYITKGIVQSMKGRIDVRSRPKEFTEMVLQFPLADETLDVNTEEIHKSGKV